jgi:hypothetical protein
MTKIIKLAVKCLTYTFKEDGKVLSIPFSDAATFLENVPASMLSSGESGIEEGKVFAQKAPWRNDNMTQLIKALNTYAHIEPQLTTRMKRGNPGLLHVHHHNKRVPASAIVPQQLSISLYDPAWLNINALPPHEKKDLGICQPMTIPRIVSILVSSPFSLAQYFADALSTWSHTSLPQWEVA